MVAELSKIITKTLGVPVGQTNYCRAPSTYVAAASTNDLGWFAVNGTPSTIASGTPRQQTTGTAIQFLSTSSGGYLRYRFQADDADLTKKLAALFAVIVAAGEFKFQVFSGTDAALASAAEIYPNQATSGVFTLPATTGNLQPTFDTTTRAFYELRWTSLANTKTIKVSDVFIGSTGYGGQSIPGGPVYPTKTWVNSTGLTVADSNLTFQRLGELLIINGTVTFTGTGSSGSKLSLQLSGISPVVTQTGSIRVEETTTSYAYTYLAYADGTQLDFYRQNIGSAAFGAARIGSDFGSGASGKIQTVYFNSVVVKVTEWAGASSGVPLMGDNIVRQNARTAYSGANPTSLPATTDSLIKFQNKILDASNDYSTSTGYYTAPRDGDYLVNVQLGLSGTGFTTISAYLIAGGSTVKANVQRVASSSVPASMQTFSKVLRLNKGDTVYVLVNPNGSGVGLENTLNTSFDVIALADYSAGQPVGFGDFIPAVSQGMVPALGLPPRTDAAIPAGRVGYKKLGTLNSFNLSLANNQTVAQITLDPGNWLIYAAPIFAASGNPSQAWSLRNEPYIDLSISSSTALDSVCRSRQIVAGGTAVEDVWMTPIVRPAVVTGAPQTFYVVVFALIGNSPTLAIALASQIYAIQL